MDRRRSAHADSLPKATYQPTPAGRRSATIGRGWRFGPGVRTGLDDFSSALRLVSAGDLEAAEFWPYLVRNGVVSPLRAEPEVVPVTRGD